MKKIILLSTLVALFSFSNAFASGDSVAQDRFLGKLGQAANNIKVQNKFAMDSLAEATHRRDTLDNIEMSCFYVKSTQQALSIVEGELRTVQAVKWVMHRKDALKFVLLAEKIGAETRALCLPPRLSEFRAVGKKLYQQSVIIKSISEIL